VPTGKEAAVFLRAFHLTSDISSSSSRIFFSHLRQEQAGMIQAEREACEQQRQLQVVLLLLQ